MIVNQSVELGLSRDDVFCVVIESNVNAPVGGPAVLETACFALKPSLEKDTAPELCEVLTDENVLTVPASVVDLFSDIVTCKLDDDRSHFSSSMSANTVGASDGVGGQLYSRLPGVVENNPVGILTWSLSHCLTPDTKSIASAVLFQLVDGIF